MQVNRNRIRRLLRLPWDLVLFTVELWRAGLWFLSLIQWRIYGRSGPAHVPCAELEFGEAAPGGPSQGLCVPSRRYANLWVLRLLCPGACVVTSPTGAACVVCRASERGVLRFWRWLVGSVIMAALWIGLGAAVLAAVCKVTGWEISALFPRRAVVATRPLPRAATGPAGEVATPAAGVRAARALAGQALARAVRLRAEGNTTQARAEYEQALSLDRTLLPAYLGSAACAAALESWEDADARLDAALRLAPESAEAHQLQAEVKRRLGHADAAVLHAREACRLSPADPACQVLLSRCCRAAGDLTAARAAAEAALRARPEWPDAALALAGVRLDHGELDAAEKDYRRLLDQDGANPEARFGLAQTLAKKGRTEAAIALMATLLQRDPIYADAVTPLVDLQVRCNRPEAGIDVLKQVTARQPALYGLRARLAAMLIAVGRADEGYTAATALLTDSPGDLTAHLILAELFLSRGLPTLAEEHCLSAMAQSPGDVRAYRLRALAWMAKGKFPEAGRDLEVLANAFPGDLDLRLQLATCYQRLGRTQDALASASQAVADNPEAASALLQLAALHTEEKSFGQAIDCYRRALRLQPENLIALNTLATLLLDRKDGINEGVELAGRASRLFPDDANVADTLGWAHYRRQEIDTAVSLLQDAARRLRRSPTVQYHLGAALHAQGKLIEARQALHEALMLGKDFRGVDDARRLLADIGQRLEPARN